MLTLNFGVAQLRSALEWSESALGMLTAAEAASPAHQLSTPDRAQPVQA
jgi:hypothetical protein